LDPAVSVLSCDAREPSMLSAEINDHGIVIKREKAVAVGRYFSLLLSADLEACHKSVQTLGLVAHNRGCNSEMILKWILQENNVTVRGVPQSLLPFERSVVVSSEGGKKQAPCFHKFCQSKEAPLDLCRLIARQRQFWIRKQPIWLRNQQTVPI